eukprot:TRINITY_DN3461_c0_g1_i1.p1 TRINITY_DN3461_c0_g1~~TRINITY_DN3461_c0_g1_i1.p1  ORF type:complete len:706 (+),score=141.48 TRINITY_DN3461_c0_g1_i1:202-2319(+)
MEVEPSIVVDPVVSRNIPELSEESHLLSHANAPDRFATYPSKSDPANDDLDLDYTFWFMKKRQYERILKGTVEKPKDFGYIFVWLFSYLCFYGGYLFLQIWYFKRQNLSGYKLEFILMGFISLTSGVVSSRFGWLIRFWVFEVYAYCFIFFVEDWYYQPTKYGPIAGAFAGGMLLTGLVFLIYPYLLRCYLICSGSVTPKIVPKSIEDADSEGVRIEIAQKSFFSTTMECVYQGPIKDGKPDGNGIWIDTSQQGEFLQGLWANGVPVGPFVSLENGTKSMLVNLRIPFATNAGGRFWTERIGLHYGVASVESCVSGKFIKGYPKVEFILPSSRCFCKKHCVCVSELTAKTVYRHIDDDKLLKSVHVSIDKRNIAVSGFKSVKKKQDKITITMQKKGRESQLILDEDWISSDTSEGLLYIHGYDHNLKDSLKRFGQFLALGHFPPHIKPFVFNWPSSSNPLFYWCAHSVASDNDVHRDLKKFIRGMKKAGIKHLHIMCHSMGVRFLLRSFPMLRDLFSLRLTSPNSSFHEDLHMHGSELISPIASPHGSMRISEDSIGGRTYKANPDGIELINLVLLNPDYELETFKNDYIELQPYCNKITIYADHRDAAIRLAFQMTSKLSLGNNINPLVDSRGRFLDIDLIDTSDLDRNTSSSFHSFFNVNRLMVDDLWELIVTGKRAEERSSRLKRWGQVYRFTILPSSVVMV